jgi:hypothetical protein
MFAFSKRKVDPSQPRATGVASDAMSIQRPDESSDVEEPAEETLPRPRGGPGLPGRGVRRVGTTATPDCARAVRMHVPPGWRACITPRSGSRLIGERADTFELTDLSEFAQPVTTLSRDGSNTRRSPGRA